MNTFYLFVCLLFLSFCGFSQNEPRIKNMNQTTYNALVKVKLGLGLNPVGQINAEEICRAMYKDRKLDSAEAKLVELFGTYDAKFYVEPKVKNAKFPQVFFNNSAPKPTKEVFLWFGNRMKLKEPTDTLANKLFFDEGNTVPNDLIKLINGSGNDYKIAQAAIYQYLKYYLQFSNKTEKFALFRDKIGSLFFAFSVLPSKDFKSAMVLTHQVADTLNKENGNKIPLDIYDWILKI